MKVLKHGGYFSYGHGGVKRSWSNFRYIGLEKLGQLNKISVVGTFKLVYIAEILPYYIKDVGEVYMFWQ